MLRYPQCLKTNEERKGILFGVNYTKITPLKRVFTNKPTNRQIRSNSRPFLDVLQIELR